MPIKTKSLLDDGVPRDTCCLCVLPAAAAFVVRVFAISAEGCALYSRCQWCCIFRSRSAAAAAAALITAADRVVSLRRFHEVTGGDGATGKRGRRTAQSEGRTTQQSIALIDTAKGGAAFTFELRLNIWIMQ